MSVRLQVVNGIHGRPAAGMDVRLFSPAGGTWAELAHVVVAEDGQAGTVLSAGSYRLEFDVDGYFTALGLTSFYPAVILPIRVIPDGYILKISLIVTPASFFVYKTS